MKLNLIKGEQYKIIIDSQLIDGTFIRHKKVLFTNNYQFSYTTSHIGDTNLEKYKTTDVKWLKKEDIII